MLNAIDGVIANVDSFNRLDKVLAIGLFAVQIWAVADLPFATARRSLKGED